MSNPYKLCQGCSQYDSNRCKTYPNCERKVQKNTLIDDSESATMVLALAEKLGYQMGALDGKLSLVLQRLDSIEMRLEAIDK